MDASDHSRGNFLVEAKVFQNATGCTDLELAVIFSAFDEGHPRRRSSLTCLTGLLLLGRISVTDKAVFLFDLFNFSRSGLMTKHELVMATTTVVKCLTMVEAQRAYAYVTLSHIEDAVDQWFLDRGPGTQAIARRDFARWCVNSSRRAMKGNPPKQPARGTFPTPGRPLLGFLADLRGQLGPYDDGNAEKRRTTSYFRAGDKVKACLGGVGEWYEGTVSSVNADGSYDIVYDEGDEDKNVRPEWVRHARAPDAPGAAARPKILAGTAGRGLTGAAKASGTKAADTTSGGGSGAGAGQSPGGGSPTRRRRPRGRLDGEGFSEEDDGGEGDSFGDNSFNDSLDYDEDKELDAEDEAWESAGYSDAGDLVTPHYLDGKPMSQRRRYQGKPRKYGPRASPSFRVGEMILARYGGRGAWQNATVVGANRDGTFNVRYANGDSDGGLVVEWLKRVAAEDDGAGADIEDEDGPPPPPGSPQRGGLRRGRGGARGTRADGSTRGRVRFAGLDGDEAEPQMRAPPPQQLHQQQRQQQLQQRKTAVEVRAEARAKAKASESGSSSAEGTKAKPAALAGAAAAGQAEGKEQGGSTTSPSNRAPRGPVVHGEYKDGDVVEACLGGTGKWFKGAITAVYADDTYDVLYDDGDKDKRVLKAWIRHFGLPVPKAPPKNASPKGAKDGDASTKPADAVSGGGGSDTAPTPPAKAKAPTKAPAKAVAFKVGDRLQSQLNGRGPWFDGTVAAVHYGIGGAGTPPVAYDITQLDGETDKNVKADWVRPKAGPPPSKAKAKPTAARQPAGPPPSKAAAPVAKAKVDTSSYGSETKATSGADGDGVGKSGGDGSTQPPKLAVGDSVQARLGGKGRWFAATVTCVNADGTVDVEYPDGDEDTGLKPGEAVKPWVKAKLTPEKLGRVGSQSDVTGGRSLGSTAGVSEAKEASKATGSTLAGATPSSRPSAPASRNPSYVSDSDSDGDKTPSPAKPAVPARSSGATTTGAPLSASGSAAAAATPAATPSTAASRRGSADGARPPPGPKPPAKAGPTPPSKTKAPVSSSAQPGSASTAPAKAKQPTPPSKGAGGGTGARAPSPRGASGTARTPSPRSSAPGRAPSPRQSAPAKSASARNPSPRSVGSAGSRGSGRGRRASGNAGGTTA